MILGCDEIFRDEKGFPELLFRQGVDDLLGAVGVGDQHCLEMAPQGSLDGGCKLGIFVLSPRVRPRLIIMRY